MTELSELEARVIKLALDGHDVTQLCYLVDYDPRVGRVDEHWRVRPVVLRVIETLLRERAD